MGQGPTTSLSERGGLPREARIRRRADFVRIQRQGKRIHTDAFTIIVAPREGGALRRQGPSPGIGTPSDARKGGPLGPRFGCAVSRRIGPAVVRNRIRRILKEIFRRQASALPPVDLVVVAKPNARALAERGLLAVAENLVPAIERGLIGKTRERGPKARPGESDDR